MSGGSRSFLAFWMGGASAPSGKSGGYRSLAAFWIGGATAPGTVPPPIPSFGLILPIDTVYGSDAITRVPQTIARPYGLVGQALTLVVSAGYRLSASDVFAAFFTKPGGGAIATSNIVIGTGDLSTVVGRYFAKTYVLCTLPATDVDQAGIWHVELMVNSSLGADGAFSVALHPSIH